MGKFWALLAPSGFREETQRELLFKGLKPVDQREDLFLFEGEPRPVAWSAVLWNQVERLSFSSISDAAKKLRSKARKWELLPLQHQRRATLIHEQLRPYRVSSHSFPTRIELEEGVGVFGLLSESEALWCRSFDRPDPLGRVVFHEDKESAPSRAYLKLWEALCLRGEWPSSEARCLDLGSSPGGWTWVLASLGAKVISVDRSELDPRVARMPGVEFRKGDAFKVLPGSEGPVDWLCCDVISAPERLLELVQAWQEKEGASRFVCTLKFQGKADPALVAEFERLGRVLHLHHNKHELTFLG